jgi:hypothetical protein
VEKARWQYTASHGGGYQYRLCLASEPLTEECFKKLPLKFAQPYGHTVRFADKSVQINATLVPDQVTGTGDWMLNPIPSFASDYVVRARAGTTQSVSRSRVHTKPASRVRSCARASARTHARTHTHIRAHACTRRRARTQACDYVVPAGEHCGYRCPGCGAPTYAADSACPGRCAEQYPQYFPSGFAYVGSDPDIFPDPLPGFDATYHDYAVEDALVVPDDIPAGDYVLGWRWVSNPSAGVRACVRLEMACVLRARLCAYVFVRWLRRPVIVVVRHMQNASSLAETSCSPGKSNPPSLAVNL